MHASKPLMYLLFLFCILLHPKSFSQSFIGSPFSKDDSLIKRGYYQDALEQYESDMSLVPKEQRKEYQPHYTARLNEVKELILSSRSVTVPHINDYLQAVVKNITEPNTVLERLKLNLFFTRDWWPNASSMGEGSIAINGGLFIHLENEAELAFIICHEMAHEFLQHGNKAIAAHIAGSNDPELQKELKRLSKSKYRVNQQVNELSKSFAFTSRRHSRLHEQEADSLAFVFLSKTKYSLVAAKTALQKLNQIDEASLFKPWDIRKAFSFPGQPFKERWLEKETGLFNAMNAEFSAADLREQDSLKTHPDCRNRIAYVSGLLKPSASAGAAFMVSEQQFTELKTAFVLEMAEQCFRTDELSRHLYFCLQLLDLDEKTKSYAAFSLIKGFNKLYDHQKAHTIGHLIETENSLFTDEYNLLLRMLDRLTLHDILIINKSLSEKYQLLLTDYPSYKEELTSLHNKLKNQQN